MSLFQPIPLDTAHLPEFASYEGDLPELAALRGKFIRTADVEKIIPVLERRYVWVENENERWQPWKGVYLQDTSGVWQDGEPLPKVDPRAMDRGDLGSLGFTDGDLIRLAKEHLGETWEPDRPGKSMKRRELFDRLMAKLFE